MAPKGSMSRPSLGVPCMLIGSPENTAFAGHERRRAVDGAYEHAVGLHSAVHGSKLTRAIGRHLERELSSYATRACRSIQSPNDGSSLASRKTEEAPQSEHPHRSTVRPTQGCSIQSAGCGHARTRRPSYSLVSVTPTIGSRLPAPRTRPTTSPAESLAWSHCQASPSRRSAGEGSVYQRQGVVAASVLARGQAQQTVCA
jgi:hypothetical protein